MKNRGYTLLELLGVIIILAVLAIVIFPSVINFIEKSSEEIDEYSMKLINNAVDLYIKNRQSLYIEKKGSKFGINGVDLIDDGNIPDSIKKDIQDKCVQVEHNGDKFLYRVKNEGDCKENICVLAGDSTEKGLNNGVKYYCKVAPDKEPYIFYVLYEDDWFGFHVQNGNYVNLIMDQNIYSDGTPAGMKEVKKEENPNKYSLVAWNSSGSKTQVPVTAINFLKNATKSWKNVEYIVIKEGISSANSTTPLPDTERIASETRMPIYLNDETKTEITNKTTSPYLYLNLTSSGYWCQSYSSTNSSKAMIVKDDTVSSQDMTSFSGVRPVISVLKSQMYFE